MSRHRTLTGKNIHGPYRRLFANAAERLGDTEVYVEEESIAGGSGNPAIGLQVDTLTEWVLQNHNPITWVAQTVVIGPHLIGGADHLPSTFAQVNTKVSDADLVAFAGQIGGTPALPDIRGIREIGGPTLLAIGAIADGQYLKRSGGSVVGDVPVFGLNYDRQESEPESSTTALTFQIKVSLTTPALTGTFRVCWSAQVNNANKKSEAHLYNVTDAVVLGPTQLYRISDGNDHYPRYTAAKEVIFTGAAKTFQIQWRSLDGSAANIRGAYIEFWRVK